MSSTSSAPSGVVEGAELEHFVGAVDVGHDATRFSHGRAA